MEWMTDWTTDWTTVEWTTDWTTDWTTVEWTTDWTTVEWTTDWNVGHVADVYLMDDFSSPWLFYKSLGCNTRESQTMPWPVLEISPK